MAEKKVFAIDESTLSRYISNKIYYAKPMKRGVYCENRGWDVPENENPDDDGYLILYPDGYVSWNLKFNFEDTSRRTDDMSFGMAIAAMRNDGQKVARRGWNGKDMFLFLTDGTEVHETEVRTDIVKELAIAQPNGHVEILPHIDMWTTNREGRRALLCGWLASQTDMLSDDWFIVD